MENKSQINDSFHVYNISIPYFQALNTSVAAKQAELAFDMAMAWIEGNRRLEHLIRFLPAEPDQNSKPGKANHRNRRQRTTATRRRR